jgi:hypothetical protein
VRTWDSEAGGWRVEIPGTDDGTGKPKTYLSNSDEGRAMESAWQAQADQKRDAHFANVGNWQQYENGSLEDFTSVLGQDPFFAARLPHYARDVMNGDTFNYNMEFNPSSGNTARGHEITNRYIALLNQGYTDQEIMGAGYGNDGSSWSDIEAAKPTPQASQMLSGTGTSGAANMLKGGLMSGGGEALRDVIYGKAQEKIFGE